MAIKRASGLFRKYFFVTISIILISFVFVGGALLLLVSKYWMEEKISLLKENAVSVAQNTRDVLSSDYLGESGRGSIIVICNTLLQISNAIDADVFVCNPQGYVVYCKEILRSDMVLSSDNCAIHSGYKIPDNIMLYSMLDTYSTTGNLGASGDLSFIVGTPIVVNDVTVGVVYATQPIVEGLSPYVMAIFRMFSFASILAMFLAFITAYFQTFRLTQPLNQMSAAAKQYAKGDFSTRITIKKKFLNSSDDEIAELVGAFNSMAQALATTEASRRSFVANVSHELKTPMTTIGGFIDGLLDGTIDESKREYYLKIVSSEVKRLSRLVTGMLNMSKIEAGELDINPRRFDISGMLVRTLLGFEQLIDKKNIEIRGLDTMEENPVTADEDMINQVIYNLIDNAVKFTPEGGYIEAVSKTEGNMAFVRLRNSCKGISSDELNRIFERFYKVDKSRSFDVKGAGMGLYISKTIVELHDGKITVASEEGKYAEFAFRIPINRV